VIVNGKEAPPLCDHLLSMRVAIWWPQHDGLRETLCEIYRGKSIFAFVKASLILAIKQIAADISPDSADGYEKTSVPRRLIILERACVNAL